MAFCRFIFSGLTLDSRASSDNHLLCAALAGQQDP